MIVVSCRRRRRRILCIVVMLMLLLSFEANAPSSSTLLILLVIILPNFIDSIHFYFLAIERNGVSIDISIKKDLVGVLVVSQRSSNESMLYYAIEPLFRIIVVCGRDDGVLEIQYVR